MPDNLQHVQSWPQGPYISKVRLPGSNSYYYIKDAAAREAIEALMGSTAFLGVTTTPLTDQCTTNPIVIDGESVTAVNGNIAIYEDSTTHSSAEFIFNGTKWYKFGDLGILGQLAYKDSVTLNKGAGIDVLQGVTATVPAHNATVSGGATDNVLGADTTFNVTQPTITVNPTKTKIGAVVSGGSVNVARRESVLSGLGTPSTQTFVKSVSAESNKKLVKTTLQAVSGATNVLQGVTPSTQKLSTTTLRGVSGTGSVLQSITATKKVMSLQSVNTIATNENVSIPNVTANTDVTLQQIGNLGSASTWNFGMGSGDDSECLIISGANSTAPTFGADVEASKVTLGTNLTASKVTGYAANLANGNIEDVSQDTTSRAFVSGVQTTERDVAIANNTETTVATGGVGTTGGADIVTGITATDKVRVAVAGGNVDVATGATAADGTGDSIVTGVTIGESAAAITGITPTTVDVLQGVTYTNPSVDIQATGNESGYEVVTDASATATNGAVTANTNDTVAAVTDVGTVSVAQQNVNVTENKEKVAKYSDLDVTVS